MQTKRIMCYGDSNTWGVIARSYSSSLPAQRYDENTRWPCVMASLLGKNWRLIEEGLGGRTTIFDAPNEEYRRGDLYLRPCIMSHRPLDYIVIMLGTNDLQPRLHNGDFCFNDLEKGMHRIIEIVNSLPDCGNQFGAAQILLIAPPPIKLSPTRKDVSAKYDNENGCEKSQHFSSLYNKIANDFGCAFLDSAIFAEADIADGVHFTRESHLRLGKAVAEKIQEYELTPHSINKCKIIYTPNMEM